MGTKKEKSESNVFLVNSQFIAFNQGRYHFNHISQGKISFA